MAESLENINSDFLDSSAYLETNINNGVYQDFTSQATAPDCPLIIVHEAQVHHSNEGEVPNISKSCLELDKNELNENLKISDLDDTLNLNKIDTDDFNNTNFQTDLKDYNLYDTINLNESDYVNESNVMNEKTIDVTKMEKLCHFPLGRIKSIVKADPEVSIVNAESIFLISKATEFFIQLLAKGIYAVTLRRKKKTLQKKDLEEAIAENSFLEFLDGALD